MLTDNSNCSVGRVPRWHESSNRDALTRGVSRHPPGPQHRGAPALGFGHNLLGSTMGHHALSVTRVTTRVVPCETVGELQCRAASACRAIWPGELHFLDKVAAACVLHKVLPRLAGNNNNYTSSSSATLKFCTFFFFFVVGLFMGICIISDLVHKVRLDNLRLQVFRCVLLQICMRCYHILVCSCCGWGTRNEQ